MRAIAWLMAAMLCWLAAALPARAAERQVLSYQGLTASVDSSFGCGRAASVTVRAPNASAYTGDRLPFQRLLAGVRARLGNGCPILSEMDIAGYADGVPAFQATITAENDWRLPAGAGRLGTAGFVSPLARAATTCDHVRNDPFVGCWIGIDPARGRGMILNIRSDGTWYWDTPEKLALGEPVFDGQRIERSYMHLAGPYLTFVFKKGGFFNMIGPYFAAECDIMQLDPYQPFGGADPPQIFIRLRSPLKITANLLSDSEWEATGIGNPGDAEIVMSIPDDGPAFNNCVDNLGTEVNDLLLLDVALLAVPALRFPTILTGRYVSRIAQIAIRSPAKYRYLLVSLRRSLPFYERSGGHLIERHVAQTEATLIARLVADPKIRTASSFTSLAQAEKAVSIAFKYEVDKIANWISSGAVGRLTIEAPFRGGLLIARGTKVAQQGTGVRVVLQGNGEGSYFILTGYPIPW